MTLKEDRPPTRQEEPDRYPLYRSHYRPRTRTGRTVLIVFLLLFALTQPPVVHGLANRIQPWIFGLPFLYVYLLAAYISLIAVLVHALRRSL